MGWRDEIGGILAPRQTPPVREDVRRPKKRQLREETEPDTIAKLRTIVADKTAAKIDGVLVDIFSSSAALQVYDHLNDDNKRKMAGLPIRKMMGIVLKMLARQTG